ncbi:hypothetical protein CAC42_3927 [Sphaceloma murrayae]|uniref:CCD97-like C-terminal domain-containing protein n=1 Tax=Sphaceloma murrayae TaxID=2082308 RepID=A0A2K1QS99_9PEZI|nr:hypothetical protein CAC42_3927 [Sphaceloma murrayae]
MQGDLRHRAIAPAGVETETQRAARLRIKTRRRRYLETHPEYFDDPGLELGDPLLYDRMIRHFQSAAEREEDGKKKGYSGKLEADLTRAEAKIHALANPDPNSPLVYRRDAGGTIVAVDQNEEDRPRTKQQGQQKWREVMEQRFLRGEDYEFNYAAIDNNVDYDDREEETRQVEDAYFAEQVEEYLGDGSPAAQTGVQDF